MKEQKKIKMLKDFLKDKKLKQYITEPIRDNINMQIAKMEITVLSAEKDKLVI